MASKVAGAKIVLETESAQAIRDLKKTADQVQRLRKTVDRSANRIKYAFNKIRRAAQVVASVFIVTAAIKQFARLAASIEMAQERIALMQARMQQFGRSSEAFVRIYRVSQTLGVTLEESAQGMTRLLIATRSIGTTAKELENVQRNIVLLGRAGGTSAEEMKGALIQLTQGMASGRLQGEELRSVLENLPLVAMEIAKELEIDIGLIREFAAEGKISTEVIVRALQDVEVKMEDLPETFSMAMSRMKNEWQLFAAALGESFASEQFLNEFASAISLLRIQALKDYSTVPMEQLKVLYAAETDLERQRAIMAEIAKREQTERKINEAEEARLAMLIEEINLLELPQKRRSSYFTNFISQFETIEERIQKARSTLEFFREDIIALFGQEKYDQIAADIEKIGGEIEEIDMNSLPRMRSTAKESFDEVSEFAKQAARNMQDAFADFFYNIGTGFDNMVEDFLNAIRRMLANQLARQFLSWLWPKGAESLEGKASGGAVSAGKPYLIGEQGPELWVPQQSGMVIPNHTLAGAGGPSISYNIDARGADEAAVVARMVPLLERTVEITKNEVRRDMREGRMI